MAVPLRPSSVWALASRRWVLVLTFWNAAFSCHDIELCKRRWRAEPEYNTTNLTLWFRSGWFNCTLLCPQRCCNHLGASSPQQADAHYRAVCRALVAEALELSSFLEKVSQGTQELRAKAEAESTDLDKLQFTDWVSGYATVCRKTI